jgi:hypothetical protein
MHLVGFYYKNIYHDAHFSEYQKKAQVFLLIITISSQNRKDVVLYQTK